MGCLKLAYNNSNATLKVVYGKLYKSKNSCAGVNRYGFNGQMKSPEIGEDTYTALYWEYSANTGMRWNLDPKPNPSISPYATFENNPIWNSDPLGDTIIVGQNTAGKRKYIERSKNEYLGDLKNKTGLDLIIGGNGSLMSRGGVTNEGISSTARNELLNLIANPINISVDFFNDKHGASHVDQENNKQILLNTAKYVNASNDLNSTTFGLALSFFHETFHTPIYNSFKHKQIETGIDAPDIFANKIRAELSISQHSNYGQRLAYTPISNKEMGKSFIPMSISSKDVYDKLVNLWNISFDKKLPYQQREEARLKISSIKIPKEGVAIIK